MAFDKSTRNRLARFVADGRGLIAEEFTQQFQSLYGISPEGVCTPLEKLTHLDEIQLATAALLRERIDYLVKTHPDDRDGTQAAVARLAREQAFTILNRFAAIRMAEKRGLMVESIGKGYQSKGFKVYETVTGNGLGETYQRYRLFLFCLFDEFAVDLGVLFDRHSPQALLFPREQALLALLDLINHSEIEPLWAEDETIGWIYQYYNDPEERKKMRAESAAPRNSRELAVRNQFFTPRYVVEFLTDNTLGRIWYEMTRGQTRLAEQCRYLVRRPTEIFLAEGETAPKTPDQEGLSQEELLKQPVHIPHRPLKDPREIRLLDPACGSMHFGLYAFDLFETIYDEAWDSGSCPGLHQAYPSKDEFLQDVPRLIIEHNIHGVDIDPRAVQIAGLSLWLRAQKAWQARGVKPADRPRVRRSNIVCAEPMPGSPEMLEEFVATLDPPLLGELVKTVFDKMQLAGEAGSLLKIEEEIRTAIDTARKQWLKQQDDLLTRKDGSQEEFFDTAEQQVIDALRVYAEQADADSYQRRLFADDAARGFAFIDLCRKRYDAVVMNPPFGEPTGAVTEKIAPIYPKHGGNLAIMFHDCAFARLDKNGSSGAVVDNTILVKSTYSHFRKRFAIDKQLLQNVVYLGWGTLDGANVEVSLDVMSASPGSGFNVIDASSEHRAENLRSAVNQLTSAEGLKSIMPLSSKSLSKIPNMSISFSEETHVHAIGKKLSESLARAKQGLAPVDTPRFIRLQWEAPVSSMAPSWRPLNHGGAYSPFYRDHSFVINWRSEGAELKAKVLHNYPYLGDNWGWVVKNDRLYGKAGLAYGKRTDLLSVQIQNKEMLFSNEGFAIFPLREEDNWFALGYLNSPAVGNLLNTFCGQHKVSGYVDSIPVPPFPPEARNRLSSLAVSGYGFARELVMFDETGNGFVGIKSAGQSLSEWFSGFLQRQKNLCQKQILLLAEADAIVESQLGSIERRTSKPIEFEVSEDSYIASIVSHYVGTAFGRWDIRYATGERQPPELPDPFDPLPVCPPGMLQNAEGLPAEPKDVPTDYPLRISWPGILVDDENHPEDIVARVREAIEVIWKDRAEAIEQEACGILGVKTLRDYFRRPAAFFADHLKRYSKSRRQAPIYWPLSTKSGSYTLWLYYHRLTDQTLHTCLADFLDPKIRKVQSELDGLTGSGSGGTRAGELREFLDELKDLRDEIERVIKLPWKPNLNDGVLITASPLWKLFRLPKWQKDLKACWDKLAKGEYDWAHLAHTIWPQRVEKACEKDRSIAIAHGLEHLCKVEPPKPNKKRGKKAAEEEIEDDEPELIEED